MMMHNWVSGVVIVCHVWKSLSWDGWPRLLLYLVSPKGDFKIIFLWESILLFLWVGFLLILLKGIRW